MGSKTESAYSSRSSTRRGAPGGSGASRQRIGTVGRPHGTHGAFAVVQLAGAPELLDAGSEVFVGGRLMTVASRRGTSARPLLELEGVQAREAAAELVGAEIAVAREGAAALEPGEYLVDDLVGCIVSDGGRAVGTVRGVLTLPSVDCLEVERRDRGAGEPLLVPLVADAVRSLDLQAKRIEVDLLFVESAGRPPRPR